MGLFSKNKVIPDNEFADHLLRSIMTLVSQSASSLRREEPFSKVEAGRISFELATLAFWDLNLLGYPFDLWQSVLNRFFETNQLDRDSVLKIMEERSKSYFEAWGDGKSSKSLMMLTAAVARNISEELVCDIGAWILIAPFFSSVDGMNVKNLTLIMGRPS